MSNPTVMTVLGPVAPETVGITSTHDHLLINMACYHRQPVEVSKAVLYERPVSADVLGFLRRDPLCVRDNLGLLDFDVAVEEVMEFRNLGGGTIVDVTLADTGRDPVALQQVARLTGLNIVAGCGHYVSLAHPPEVEAESETQIVDRLLDEIESGIGETGVRPGVIGEIGTTDPLHPNEEKVLRCVARVQQETGLAISLHLDPAAGKGVEILDILEAAGADPHRVVMGHLDATIETSLAYHEELARRGTFIQYDAVGSENYWPGLAGGRAFWLPADSSRARAVAHAFEHGYGDKILLGHDICKKMDLRRYGGFGYGHIIRNFVRNLRDVDLSVEQIDQVLVANPQRMLTRV